ncbi:hypothetical protein [Phytohabitans houttuyneae]|uniref:DUF732 domain-containing protein n=1 Tax=Phytohabitans houttuyneae TaxID=1076126 RepID=A0A6V8KMF5_9ACTN|nr:hypothetical protein [Phytohabitans houttuyneae]GFJ83399.1 hypothetical protein Phou_075790 [Phytohabitans houttuyneae]
MHPQHQQPPAAARRRRKVVTVLAVVGGVLGLGLVIVAALAVLGGGEEQGTAGPPAATTATTTAAATVAAAAAGGVPPEPDQKTWDAYIADLNAISPLIVGGDKRKDEEKAVDRGRDQCANVADGFDDQKLVDLVIQRFTSPARPDGFDRSTATRILLVVRQHICPSY